MKKLDVSRINEAAPYEVAELKNRSNYYGFISNADVKFAVGFDEDDFIASESYQLIIANINCKPSPNDKKVRDTVFAVIQEFFRVNNATMLYICDTGDGKQAMRSRLFNYWFTLLADKGQFSIFQSTITDEEGIDNYYAVITRKDNPNAAQVMTEFYETTYFFSHKPNDQ